jgi:hypothetical protein
MSFYQQTRAAGMETANISHIDVNIRINVCNELKGGIHCAMYSILYHGTVLLKLITARQ